MKQGLRWKQGAVVGALLGIVGGTLYRLLLAEGLQVSLSFGEWVAGFLEIGLIAICAAAVGALLQIVVAILAGGSGTHR